MKPSQDSKVCHFFVSSRLLCAAKDLIMVKPDACFSLQLLEQYTIKNKLDSFSKSQEDN